MTREEAVLESSGLVIDLSPVVAIEFDDEDAAGREVREWSVCETLAKGGPGRIMADEHCCFDLIRDSAGLMDDLGWACSVEGVDFGDLLCGNI